MDLSGRLCILPAMILQKSCEMLCHLLISFLEASRVRKEYDDASSKLSKIQSRISTLTDKLKHDFGKSVESLFTW